MPSPNDDRRQQRERLDAIEDRYEQVPRHSHFEHAGNFATLAFRTAIDFVCDEHRRDILQSLHRPSVRHLDRLAAHVSAEHRNLLQVISGKKVNLIHLMNTEPNRMSTLCFVLKGTCSFSA